VNSGQERALAIMKEPPSFHCCGLIRKTQKKKTTPSSACAVAQRRVANSRQALRTEKKGGKTVMEAFSIGQRGEK